MRKLIEGGCIFVCLMLPGVGKAAPLLLPNGVATIYYTTNGKQVITSEVIQPPARTERLKALKRKMKKA